MPIENGTSTASSALRKLGLFALVLSAVFGAQLWQLLRFSLHDDFFSYIPLIPVITGYLIWLKRPELPKETRGSLGVGIILALIGAAFIGGFLACQHAGKVPLEDYLFFMTAAYLFFLGGGAWAFLGSSYCKVILFPLLFALFMIPMPTIALERTESFFQLTSAATASGMLQLMGMPVLRERLILQLPGYAIEVAPECSGIHSTMVLLMTGFLAGYLFLRSTWKQILLVLIVVPLAILRNGFRIFVISELCVKVSHDMIDSPIHHQGGPIFFALSLIPFFGLLLYLRKTDYPRSAPAEKTVPV